MSGKRNKATGPWAVKGIVHMGNATRGRPREEGERYPSGKKKPQPPIDTMKEPISGAVVQRMLSAEVRRYSEAGYGKEATRLWMDGKLSPAELATGLRFAGIYGRFEYHNGLPRSAAAPHYIREYVATGTDDEDESPRSEETPDERAQRIVDADAEFKWLQEILSPEHRAALEALFVDDKHIAHHLPKAKTALAILAEAFKDKEDKKPKKDRKKKHHAASFDPAPEPKAPTPNTLKDAFFAVRRKRSPKLSDADIECEWGVLCALKSREDFRLEKAR